MLVGSLIHFGGMSVSERLERKERKVLVMSMLKTFPLWKSISFLSLSRGLSWKGLHFTQSSI